MTPAQRLARIKKYFKDNHIPWGREPMTFEFNTNGGKVKAENKPLTPSKPKRKSKA